MQRAVFAARFVYLRIMIEAMEKYTICELISQSVRDYPDNPAMKFVDSDNAITYRTLGIKVQNLAGYLDLLGIKKGDKVGLIGENSPEWGISYLGILCTGAVVVPILPDFHEDEVNSIIDHAECKLILASTRQRNRLSAVNSFSGARMITYDTQDFTSQLSKFSGEIPRSLCMSCTGSLVKEEDLAAIIYTSGTTGSSKGVMLSHKNISWLVHQCLTLQDVDSNDRFLSILPMSHTYENSLGFLLPLHRGATVYFLGKTPTPGVLTEALKKVKPTLILTVPLIIEKIFRKQVLPKFNASPVLRFLFRQSPTRILLNRMAGKKLKKVFGGNLRFFGIGGAKMDPLIEKYLREARFPYAVGYGLTETSPLLAGGRVFNSVWQSTGKALEGVDLKLIEINPATGEGEIVAKGPNVMKGYYKNPEATAEVFTTDGYFRTGDLGYIDSRGNVFIRGRIKSVILGNNGENIYPEEIESLINSIQGVEESLVVNKKGRIVAMVNFNVTELENRIIKLNEKAIQVTQDKMDEVLREIQQYVNQRVNRYSRLQLVVLHPGPFEKTPTNKIKRYLYGE